VANFDGSITFLYTRDLSASADFYENKLGLEPVYVYGKARIYKINGGAHIGVFERDNMPEQSFEYPGRNIVFTFLTDDVDGWYEKMVEMGVEIAGEPGADEEYGIYTFFVRDPSNYWIEFQKFLNPGWKPGGKEMA